MILLVVIEEDENKRSRIVSTIDTNRNTMKESKKEEIGCSSANI
jgi:hypothetical protein